MHGQTPLYDFSHEGRFTADEVVSFDLVDKTRDVLAADFADYIQTSLRQHSFVVLCCTE